jgi:hypothetical protein
MLYTQSLDSLAKTSSLGEVVSLKESGDTNIHRDCFLTPYICIARELSKAKEIRG